MTPTQYEIFKKGSRTYFYSSIFFPEPYRSDVFTLYSFVRVADDFVDAVPQQADEFYAFRESYQNALAGNKSGNMIIDSFIDLMKRKNFEPSWIEAFLDAMAADLTKSTYTTIEETKKYMYGSAEVIGLFMARIMNLHPDSHRSARMLGRAMQYINFIRDIDEDRGFGRTYLPLTNTVTSLDKEKNEAAPEPFVQYVRREIDRYLAWQKEAEEGFIYIPKRFLIPIKTASDMYKWTARVIEADPFVVYQKKVKPGVPRLAATLLKNSITIRKTKHPSLKEL